MQDAQYSSVSTYDRISLTVTRLFCASEVETLKHLLRGDPIYSRAETEAQFIAGRDLSMVNELTDFLRQHFVNYFKVVVKMSDSEGKRKANMEDV